MGNSNIFTVPAGGLAEGQRVIIIDGTAYIAGVGGALTAATDVLADIDLSNLSVDGKQNIIDQMAYVPGSKQGGDNTTVFALNTVYEAEHDGIAYMWVKSASTSLCSVVLGSALDSELKNNYMYEKNSVSGIANTAVSAILFVPKGFHFRFWAENHNISAGYNFSFIPLKGTKL